MTFIIRVLKVMLRILVLGMLIVITSGLVLIDVVICRVLALITAPFKNEQFSFMIFNSIKRNYIFQ